MTAIHRGMDRATLDAAYDNTAAVSDSQAYRARWWEASAAVRAEPRSRLNLRYGSRPRATLDYFPGGLAKSPLFAFIHGGYWQRNEKVRISFIVPGPRAHGINVAIAGYTLAPEARLKDIVAEMRPALTFLMERAGDFGCDANALYRGGGHLAAVLPISGIFDLAPIGLGVRNDKLSLDISPLTRRAEGTPPLRLFVGANALPELKRQSQVYAQAARARGLPCSLTTLPEHHHFSILDELSDPGGALTRALMDLIMTSAK
jgi:arylformamidase